MAKRATASQPNPQAAAAGPDPATTRRAYTLRLRGPDPEDTAWREALWATHQAINKGAKVFGDWLLTLRGGLDHTLAEPPPPTSGKERSREESAALRKNRRILLALSWLSVEDARGAPQGGLRVATGQETDAVRRDKVVAALREILTGRDIGKAEIELWLADCRDSVVAKIRDDAVWINRSAAFDAARQRIGPTLTREETWDILEPFFASAEAFLAPVDVDEEADGAGEEKAKDPGQEAGQWLSSRFGTGTGADFARMAKVYEAMAAWAGGAPAFGTGGEAIKALAVALGALGPESPDADGILTLISGPGYKSATRNFVKSWGVRAGAVAADDLKKFGEIAAKDAEKCKANIGGKGRRAWSDRVLADVEAACGFTYLQTDGAARHAEFAVMLDHAARRVSIGHTWIKRAESERRRFEEDAKRLAMVPPAVAARLDRLVNERSGSSGAAAAGGDYRIRSRAIEGWDEVLKRWRRADCTTGADRIAAAREVQADPEIEKFGDIQLFEALAADDAEGVWRIGGEVDAQPLKHYVLGHDARDKQRRFKVPAYRHPDPLRHPVFGDFGNSQWSVEYAALEAAKAVQRRRRVGPQDAAWIKNPRGLRMGLWDGGALKDIDLRWSSKRLAADLAFGLETGGAVAGGDAPIRDVTRADRLGRAASGLKAVEVPSAAGLFALDDWNARLQAPRRELNALAKHVEKHGWDDRAKRMRGQISWLASFSAKLECRGPFVPLALKHGLIDPARKIELAPRDGERNDWRGIAYPIWHPANDGHKGLAKHLLSRIPELRILSVDLGHRFAAACAVWEALTPAAFKAEIAGKAVAAGGTAATDLYLHTSTPTDKVVKNGRKRGTPVVETTVYRRIGPDTLPDGSEHPAPWARLDRQFLIKLQGEERPARMASPAEHAAVQKLEADLGRIRDADHPLPWRVDELMSEAVGSVRLGLRRHGDAARIAYAFMPGSLRHTPGGGTSEHTPETRAAALLDALLRWRDLCGGEGARWSDAGAARLWDTHIRPLLGADLPALAADADRGAFKRHRAGVEEALKPVAAKLAASGGGGGGDSAGVPALHAAWKQQWDRHDPLWRVRLKWLRRWLLPRGLRARPGETQAQVADRKGRLGAARQVGGLSLTRIATIRELYQVQKAYHSKPSPTNPRAGVALIEEEAAKGSKFGDRALQAMERMREQRVKQLASRIAEAALGVGRHAPAEGGGREVKRPQFQKDPPCHAVVIESLRNYRPDELQTRRENKALMVWSSGKVRKYLEEACQLHGLHLREVMPNYTSRQCSRTGLPGIRCADVPVDATRGAVKAYWWTKAVAGAQKKVGENKQDAEAHLLVDLAAHLADLKAEGKRLPRTIRVPRKGGDLFIAAPPWRGTTGGAAGGSVKALQADLNAAANIGLRALLDPDFAGRWWYVPCDSATGKPAKDKCAGAACLDLDTALLAVPERAKSQGVEGKKPKAGDKPNAWRDPHADGEWRIHAAYWADVKKRAAHALRAINGLEVFREPPLAAPEVPW